MTFHYNQPIETKELQILKVLNRRMYLPDNCLKILQNLEKGYEGEIRFWKLLQPQLTTDCIILYDFLHKSNESILQLDCTIIQQREIWHLEIKNFEGDFQLKNRKLFSIATGKEVKNPLNQLERGKFLLNHLIHKNGYNFPLKSYVVFVHPEFTLYQHEPNLPIIHPTQIRRFLRTLNRTPSKLSSNHYKLAHKLFTTQIQEQPSERIPSYDFNQLKKGIYCLNCNHLINSCRNKVICEECGFRESKKSAIMRSIVEFNLLFPESRITTIKIWEWCGKIYTKYQIRQFLHKFFQQEGKKTGTHFLFLDERGDINNLQK